MPTLVSPLEIARRARGWTQAELAERCGLVRETVSRVERGEWPARRTIVALANALEVEPAAILPVNSNAGVTSAGAAKLAGAGSGRDEPYRAA